MNLKEKFKKTIFFLQKEFPNSETELNYKSPFQLLVSVILSAQCTDKRVNIITKNLFEKYPDAKSLSKASEKEIYEFIKTCSYPNNKANYILNMSKKLLEDFNEIVPSDLENLQKLKGVGRKTANVILSIIYKKPVMAVDTHVFRVSKRIGLTKKEKTVLETEKKLIKYIPKNLIAKSHHLLLLQGRYICKARKPNCEICKLNEFCDFFFKMKKNFFSKK